MLVTNNSLPGLRQRHGHPLLVAESIPVVPTSHLGEPEQISFTADYLSIASWMFASISAFSYTGGEEEVAIAFMTLSALGRVCSGYQTAYQPLVGVDTTLIKKTELALVLLAHMYYICANIISIYQYIAKDNSPWIIMFLGHSWNLVDGLIGIPHLIMTSARNKPMLTKIKPSNKKNIVHHFYQNIASAMNYNTVYEKGLVHLSFLINIVMLGMATLSIFLKKPYGAMCYNLFALSMLISGLLAAVNPLKSKLSSQSDIDPLIHMRFRSGISVMFLECDLKQVIIDIMAGLPNKEFNRITPILGDGSDQYYLALESASIGNEIDNMIGQARTKLDGCADNKVKIVFTLVDTLKVMINYHQQLMELEKNTTDNMLVIPPSAPHDLEAVLLSPIDPPLSNKSQITRSFQQKIGELNAILFNNISYHSDSYDSLEPTLTVRKQIISYFSNKVIEIIVSLKEELLIDKFESVSDGSCDDNGKASFSDMEIESNKKQPLYQKQLSITCLDCVLFSISCVTGYDDVECTPSKLFLSGGG